jgi:hypothetical protein
MIELTDQQREEMKNQNGTVIDVIDPHTKHEYVLVPKEVYERIKGFLHDDSEWTESELRSLLARSAEGNGWNEPAMEDYDDYEAKRTKPCR